MRKLYSTGSIGENKIDKLISDEDSDLQLELDVLKKQILLHKSHFRKAYKLKEDEGADPLKDEFVKKKLLKIPRFTRNVERSYFLE